ncbi:uncharacterized protein DFL_008979 [Arthrobotrys flagrans]|uniref:Uncharacterized protein n=1 Tax=Arthrobotrys flagrans TaxID=97331 RepID=A0A436ZQN9_ARTFL|nr:hypothetical protein DFL_008979 [Arthrobotrys flagrans]
MGRLKANTREVPERSLETRPKARGQPKAKDPFQQGHHKAPRIYRKDHSPLIHSIVEDAISRGASHKEILELLAPHGNWNKNALNYLLKKHYSRKNLKLEDAAFVSEEIKRAELEGRQIPEFVHLGRSGRRVKATVIKRLRKEDHKFYNIDLDKSGESRKVRVVEPSEDYLQMHFPGDVNMGPFEEADGYFELIPGAVSYLNTFENPGADVAFSEPRTITGLQHRGLDAFDSPWEPIEPNSLPFLVDDVSPVQNYTEKAPQPDWVSGFWDDFDLQGWLQETIPAELESLDILINTLKFELNKNWGWAQAQTRHERGSIVTEESGGPNGDYGNLGYMDSPEAWAEYGLPKLNQWVKMGQVIALEVLTRTVVERKTSGIENLYTCYERLGKKWTPTSTTFLYFMDWDTTNMAPPPHILFSMFESRESIPLEIREACQDNLLQFDVPPPGVRELESQELHRIFRANFSDVVRISQTHKENERWNRGLTTMAVHLLTIEERFGPDHYFLIRALFRFTSVMERAELQSINDKDIIPLLFILLNKLSRLKLEDSLTGDIPHALIHLYRSLVRIRHFLGAKKVLVHYKKHKMKLGPWDEDLHQNKMMMLTGMELLHNAQDGTQRAKGLRYLRQVMRFFDKRSMSVLSFLNNQGNSVACFDFLQIGKYLRFAGSAGEAIFSFLISIEHSGMKPEYELSARKYEGVFELGVCYEIMGLPLKALTCFHYDYEYRKRADLLDTANPTIEALRRNLQKCGLSQRVRPTNHILMIPQAKLEKYLKTCQEIGVVDDKGRTDLEGNNDPVPAIEVSVSPGDWLDDEYGSSFDVGSSATISTTIDTLEDINPH